MGLATYAPTADSGNRYVNGLLLSSQWESDGGTTDLAFYVVGAGDVPESFEIGFPGKLAQTRAEEETAFLKATALMEEVCDVRFTRVESQAEADLAVGVVNNATVGRDTLGVASFPSPYNLEGVGFLVNGDNYWADGFASVRQGGYDFVTFTHELGHAMGLKHPHDNGDGVYPLFPGVSEPFEDYGANDLNQGVFSTMSYNTGYPTRDEGHDKPAWGWEGTYMAFDVAALQHMYGANTTHRTGDDAYVMPGRNGAGTYYACLWDAGGTDRIVAGSNTDAVIDLRPASLRNAPGSGGWLSAHDGVRGGFTIAAGAVIEDALGRAGDDAITGNAAANQLWGKGGGDVIKGNEGADALRGGTGADRLVGGAEADALWGGAGADRFVFRTLADSAGEAADVIGDFGRGADRLDLGALGEALAFVGRSAFGGAAGEVRYERDRGLGETRVLLDADGDGAADLVVRLDGVRVLGEADLVL